MTELSLEERYYLLLEYIRQRNIERGTDTPEKRLAALNERMKAAREAERERLAIEAELELVR